MDIESVPGEIGILPEYREVTGTPREVYGPYWALVERRGKEQGRGTPPQAQSKLGGGPAPLSFLPPSSSFPLPLQVGKGGVLLPVGIGLPPWVRLLLLAGRTPSLILYIRGQGAPLDTQVDPRDHILSRVRCPFHHNPR